MESGGHPEWRNDERAAESGRRFPGSDVLAGGSIEEILHRLCEGDPLHVQDRVRLALREDGWFLDPRRLTLRAMARAAYAAPVYAGDPPLGEWLRARIAEAIQDLVTEQTDEELARAPIQASPDRDFYEAMSKRLDTEPMLARLVCCELNHAPRDVRHAFYALQIEGKTFNRYVAEGNGPPEHVKDLLRDAGNRLLLALQRAFPDQFGIADDV